jgi:hypothetical protein
MLSDTTLRRALAFILGLSLSAMTTSLFERLRRLDILPW